MTEEARVLTRELLKRHEQVCQKFAVKAPKSVTDDMIERSRICYGDLCERAGVPFLTHSVGQFLGEVAEWCDENGWPLLNALAVNSESRTPGEGYDGVSGRTLIGWPDEVRKCIAFSGYPQSAKV